MGKPYEIVDPEVSAFFTRVKTQVEGRSGTTDHAGWLERNTFLDGKPFSFRAHEFQKEIVNDPSSRISCKKCSQVGLSELMVRKLCALMAVLMYKRIIFAMPAAKMVNKFSKDRIDSVLDQSPVLRGMVKTANNSAEQKILGTNCLYCTGTWGSTSGISVPAEYVIVDEVDFANQEVVSLLYSRLRHATADANGIRGYLYKFSTPTLPGYGVTEAFDQGSQKYYFVKCSKCQHDFAPNFYENLVIPKLDMDFREIRKHDIAPLKASGDVMSAYICCPKCGSDVTRDLLDPSRRRWVAKFPDRIEASYQVSPWDVPEYNPVPNILMQMMEYKKHGDFLNFVVGLEYEDADNVFMNQPFDLCMKAAWWQDGLIMSGVVSVAGCDVGKLLHFTVGIVVGASFHLVHAAEIPNAQSSGAGPILEKVKDFGVKVLCIDAGPDISLVRDVLDAMPFGTRGYAVEYVNRTGLKDFVIDQEARIIKANRTETLSGLMRDHNTLRMEYPSHPIMETVKSHLKNTKKIRLDDAAGDEKERFIKTGDDHFAHSLNYCRIAKEVLFGEDTVTTFAAVPNVSRLRLGSDVKSSDPFSRYRK